MLITVKVTAFPHMMRRELKGLKLNSCAALRKPLISETNWGKKDFISLWSTNIGLIPIIDEAG